MTEHKHMAHEPFLRIARRDGMSPGASWAIRGAGLIVALLVSGLFVYLASGISFGDTLLAMWEGTFGKIGNAKSMEIRLWDTAIYTTKLLCIAVALAPAFKMKFWNIGAEGQVLVGALSTAAVMYYGAGVWPSAVLYPVMILAGILAGAVWGIIPAVFKAKWGTNETLFTLMLNYVAMKIVDAFVNLWRGKESALRTFGGYGEGWLPKVFGKDFFINIVVFLALAVLMFIYMKKTKQGYEISVVGESRNTAKYAGINVKMVIIRTMAISGAVCGICGALTVMGQGHNISSASTAGGYGFTAIIVAWLAQFNTVGMILVAFLVRFLENGAATLGNQFAAFSIGTDKILIGLVLFFVLASEFFINYRLIFSAPVAAFLHKVGHPFAVAYGKCKAGVLFVIGKIKALFARNGKEEK